MLVHDLIIPHFLQLLLMKRGGQVIYAGPLGRHSDKLIEYFEVSILANQSRTHQDNNFRMPI